MSTDISTAEPGDIYADEKGKLWRITGVCRESTITAEAVEPHGHSSDPGPNLGHVIGGVFPGINNSVGTFLRARQSGGVGGLMWKGWNRIWRKAA